jgi:subtilisin family serine protease
MNKFGLPLETISDNPLPETIVGYVSVQGKESVFAGRSKRLHKSGKAYHATKKDRDTTRQDLESAGFTILAESFLGFSVSAPAGAYQEITGGTLLPKELLMETDADYSRYVTHIDIVGSKQPQGLGVGAAKTKKLKIDGVIIERPRVYHAVFPSPLPPASPRFHLRVPGDVAVYLNAVAAHQKGHRGDGVLVAMPDSGQFRHPFFAANGFNVLPTISVVTGANPAKDPVGHGTGESANIFAAAPTAVLQAIRISNDSGDLVGALGGFMRAKTLDPKPRIITNSWGGDGPFPPLSQPDQADLAWAAEIQDAVEQGILVVFSAGNGQFSIEPQVPGVLAAGGAFVDAAGSLRASDYTSGYESPWFNDVNVPTLSGLVGMRPRAQYIMLPVQPDCMLDREESKADPPVDPAGDGTLATDGWALFSGTSAAAPQLAGVAPLIFGAKPKLTPAQVIEAMTATAVDVVAGKCHERFDNPAVPGADLATGAGLVNAAAAVEYALRANSKALGL